MVSEVDTRAALARAVDDMYAAFGGYPHRPDMPVCSHCVTPDDVAALAGPVGSLPAAVLEPMAWKALTLFGGVDDFRRVLPRMLHLVAVGRLDVPLPAVATKLVVADWRDWPPGERAAVIGFLDALWASTLLRWPAQPDIPGCIAALDLIVDDLEPYLERWYALLDAAPDQREPALWHLATAVQRLGLAPEARTLRRLLWRDDGGPGGSSALALWLIGPTTAIQLDRATFDFAGQPVADAASSALALLAGAAASV